MPKGSKALTNHRKEEILNACAALYETKQFKDITLKDIGDRTSMTRTSIYNYFQTKEEIFLALLQKEYEAWIADLEKLRAENETMTAEGFASALAHSLEKRELLLKLLSMNHYDLEGNSSMENLVAFKVVYAASMRAVTACLEKFFPRMTPSDRQGFLYAFFPFLFGVYPYTVVSEKQRRAMEEAHANYVFLSIYEITKSMVLHLLRGMETEISKT